MAVIFRQVGGGLVRYRWGRLGLDGRMRDGGRVEEGPHGGAGRGCVWSQNVGAGAGVGVVVAVGIDGVLELGKGGLWELVVGLAGRAGSMGRSDYYIS